MNINFIRLESFEESLMSRRQSTDTSHTDEVVDNLEGKLELKDNIIDNQNRRIAQLETEITNLLAAHCIKTSVGQNAASVSPNSLGDPDSTVKDDTSDHHSDTASAKDVEWAEVDDRKNIIEQLDLQIVERTSNLNDITRNIQAEKLCLTKLSNDISHNSSIVDDVNEKFSTSKGELLRLEDDINAKQNQLAMVLQQIGGRTQEEIN